jgi:peptidyl-prolyl cis-trans isomerase SurA
MRLVRKEFILGFVLMCLPLAAWGGGLGPVREAESERFPVDGVAAYVNEHAVTIGDVMSVLQPLQQRLMQRYEGARLKKELKKAYIAALSSLIERYLILDFYKKQEMEIPDWVVDERVDTIVHETFKGDRTELLTALSKEGLSYDDWESEIRDQIIVSLMRSSTIDRNVRVSPSAVRREHARGSEEYEVPGKVKLRMIVVKAVSEGEGPSRLQKAEDIRKRLDAGEDFEALAKALSEGKRAAEGGDWGWIQPGMLRPELAQAVEGLGVDEVSEVIKTEDEVYILKIEGREDSRVASLDEVREKIEVKLRREEAERLYRSWIERLKQHAYVKVLEDQSL